MENIIKVLENAIEELRKPTPVYVVFHGKTGKVDSVWTDMGTLTEVYKSMGYVQKDCEGNTALFPEEMTYIDMYNSDFYHVQRTTLDKVSKS